MNDSRLKQRLVGAAILVALAVMFIPLLLDDSPRKAPPLTETNIPQRPPDSFDSKLVPVEAADGPTADDLPPPAPPAAREDPLPQSGEDWASAPEGPAEAVAAAGTADPAETEGGGLPAPASPPENEANTATQPEIAAAPSAEGRGSTQAGTAAVPEQRVGVAAWAVQLGSFASEQNARTLETKLRSTGYSAFVEKILTDHGSVYRVRVGPELSRASAQQIRDKLEKELALKGLVVRYP